MATKIAMPKLSDTMEEGIILKWLKKEGESVKQGEIIAEVQTDKADMELEAYDTGILRKIFVPEGKGAAVGKPIAIIGAATEDISSLLADTAAPSSGHGATASAPPSSKPAEQIQQSAAAPAAAGGDGDGHVKASPLAKAIAAQNKIDLHSISGSGPMGRIVKKDLELPLAKSRGAYRAGICCRHNAGNSFIVDAQDHRQEARRKQDDGAALLPYV